MRDEVLCGRVETREQRDGGAHQRDGAHAIGCWRRNGWSGLGVALRFEHRTLIFCEMWARKLCGTLRVADWVPLLIAIRETCLCGGTWVLYRRRISSTAGGRQNAAGLRDIS